MKPALVGALVLAACTPDETAPHLDGVTPTSARAGASISLVGDNFCGAAIDCVDVPAKFEFGLDPPMIQALVQSFASSSATIQVPPLAAGPTSILLTVEGRTSNALAFEVLP